MERIWVYASVNLSWNKTNCNAPLTCLVSSDLNCDTNTKTESLYSMYCRQYYEDGSRAHGSYYRDGSKERREVNGTPRRHSDTPEVRRGKCIWVSSVRALDSHKYSNWGLQLIFFIIPLLMKHLRCLGKFDKLNRHVSIYLKTKLKLSYTIVVVFVKLATKK